MNSNTILLIFVAIIIIVAILYLISFFLRRKNNDRLDELEKRKIALFDLPVIEEIDEVKKMHLVGQSQNTFREWSQKWVEISTVVFAEMESQIFEIENLNDSFRFVKVKQAIEEANASVDQMEAEVAEIRSALKDLRESEERNSLAVQAALDAYDEMTQLIKSDSKRFGPSIHELEKQVKKIESEFTEFVALNTSGDPMEARFVLEEAERKTYELQDTMLRIPDSYEELKKVFPDQVNEIENGYKKLKKDHYKFPGESLESKIKNLREKIRETMVDLEKLEVDRVEAANVLIAEDIDSLYEVMEKEIQAKKYVDQHKSVVLDYLQHTLKNNRQLMIELDHVSQSYTLSNNELGLARGFQAHIEELEKQYVRANNLIEENEAIYTSIEDLYKEIYKVLDEIEKDQIDIDSSLQKLRKGEKEAQRKIDEFEFKLRNLKRYVEKQRLPGIPKDYLEFFFVATDRVEELSKELNKIRIDMSEINKLVAYCQDDMDLLEEKTNELVDSAALTEQMLQYANRFRHSHPDVERAIERSLILFNREYRYNDALDEIGAALERTEPGAFKRIEAFYHNHREVI